MKRAIFLGLVIALIIGSCTQKNKKAEMEVKIENTLKTIHFYSDSTGIDPSALFSAWERINKTIDSIGYPDAGYKLWLIQGDTNKAVRFMVEGNWPTQAIYDTIHENQLYKNFKITPEEKKLFSEIKQVSYHRFTVVK